MLTSFYFSLQYHYSFRREVLSPAHSMTARFLCQHIRNACHQKYNTFVKPVPGVKRQPKEHRTQRTLCISIHRVKPPPPWKASCVCPLLCGNAGSSCSSRSLKKICIVNTFLDLSQ